MTGPDEIQLSGETGSLRIARGGVTSLEMRGCGFAAYGNWALGIGSILVPVEIPVQLHRDESYALHAVA